MPSPPLVLSIQHFCIHDGPGVRSVVFLKGCPLRCTWCQNPESYDPAAQLAFRPEPCVGCGACVEACPHGARAIPGLPDPDRCERCFACVEACPSGALLRYGDKLAASEIVDRLRPELPLMRDSGGGVTLSGGEPTLHARFTATLATALQAEGLHVAVETCGQFALDRAAPLLDHTDLVLFDCKLATGDALGEHCRGDAARIRGNLEALARRPGGPRVWPRLPLVPGVTDSDANLRAWADLLLDLGLPGLTLVPHHAMGAAKRSWLGLDAAPPRPSATPDLLARARALLSSQGITAHDPGEEPW